MDLVFALFVLFILLCLWILAIIQQWQLRELRRWVKLRDEVVEEELEYVDARLSRIAKAIRYEREKERS